MCAAARSVETSRPAACWRETADLVSRAGDHHLLQEGVDRWRCGVIAAGLRGGSSTRLRPSLQSGSSVGATGAVLASPCLPAAARFGPAGTLSPLLALSAGLQAEAQHDDVGVAVDDLRLLGVHERVALALVLPGVEHDRAVAGERLLPTVQLGLERPEPADVG
jgi:hypothetical protein